MDVAVVCSLLLVFVCRLPKRPSPHHKIWGHDCLFLPFIFARKYTPLHSPSKTQKMSCTAKPPFIGILAPVRNRVDAAHSCDKKGSENAKYTRHKTHKKQNTPQGVGYLQALKTPSPSSRYTLRDHVSASPCAIRRHRTP